MIPLTRLNGEAIDISPLQIESIQATPDVRVTLVSGRQIAVRDTVPEIRAAMLAWLRQVHAPPPGKP